MGGDSGLHAVHTAPQAWSDPPRQQNPSLPWQVQTQAQRSFLIWPIKKHSAFDQSHSAPYLEAPQEVKGHMVSKGLRWAMGLLTVPLQNGRRASPSSFVSVELRRTLPTHYINILHTLVTMATFRNTTASTADKRSTLRSGFTIRLFSKLNRAEEGLCLKRLHYVC